MASRCAGTWNSFFTRSDQSRASVVHGKLEIFEGDTSGTIKGKHTPDTSKETEFTEFEGTCVNDSVVGVHVISFKLKSIRPGWIYFFRGVLSNTVPGLQCFPTVSTEPRASQCGTYMAFEDIRLVTSGKLDVTIAQGDPGDTGGWGGNQT